MQPICVIYARFQILHNIVVRTHHPERNIAAIMSWETFLTGLERSSSNQASAVIGMSVGHSAFLVIEIPPHTE